MAPSTRVLVADDDPFVLDAVADALSQSGAEVIRRRTAVS
jgi:CheY-like chemotaxis protein